MAACIAGLQIVKGDLNAASLSLRMPVTSDLELLLDPFIMIRNDFTKLA